MTSHYDILAFLGALGAALVLALLLAGAWLCKCVSDHLDEESS